MRLGRGRDKEETNCGNKRSCAFETFLTLKRLWAPRPRFWLIMKEAIKVESGFPDVYTSL
ncbi:Bgt-20194 [Blumeria graminis f. sp. tritici]|uniref:Bgt-20194 n=2 Tax=Blumeria graminis f. sp. tritici TaxID=62690 RepID=A0A381L9Y4_BLUGR|nr:Bgt-20194 [Blumeria graminis f. sp. tritici]